MKKRIKDKLSHIKILDLLLFTIVIIVSICVAFSSKIIQYLDTQTYISAWLDNLSKGEIDDFRTPIYPIYLGIVMQLAPTHNLLFTIIGQHVVFLISLIYLKKMISWFTNSHFIECCSVLIYALYVINWNNYILTESFAISGVVFLLYNILQYYLAGRESSIVWATIWLAFLVFLRPAFLFLFPACFFAWCLFYKKYGKRVLLGILGVFIVGVLELGYCKKFEEKYGLFLPSKVSITNSFQIAILEGAVKPDYAENKTVKEYLIGLPDFYRKEAKTLWNYNGQNPMPKELSFQEQAVIVSKSRKEQPMKWVLSCWHHFFDSLSMRFPVEVGPFSIFLIYIPGTILLTIWLFIIYFLFCCFMIVTNKKIPVISAILWITSVGNYITIIIGAQAEWARLLSPSIPLLTLMIVQLLGFVNWKAIASYNEQVFIS